MTINSIFDFTDKEATDFMNMLTEKGLDYEIDSYIFDDETDEEIGYTITLSGSFTVKYDDIDKNFLKKG